MTIRLIVVDDDPLVRAGLALMLGGAGDIEIVGEGADGSEVAELVERLGPDVVLMDIRMPVMDGLAATERLRRRPHAPEVVVLTTFHADEQVLRAMRAGASGFVLKDTPPAEIVAAVRRVAAGDPVLSPAVTRQLMTHVAGSGADTRRAAALRRLEPLAGREPRQFQRGDRRGAVHERRHRQDARVPHPGQAGPQQPCPDRAVGARRGPPRRRAVHVG
jgi:DNA-binding NarL/FixJ family response regulator